MKNFTLKILQLVILMQNNNCSYAKQQYLYGTFYLILKLKTITFYL